MLSDAQLVQRAFDMLDRSYVPYSKFPVGAAIACGDYDNDIPMLKAAGLGVAMANGCPEIRKCADYITRSNEEDGVAAVIETFMLNDKEDI